MNETFQLRPFFRGLAIVGSAFFGGSFLLFTWALLASPAAGRPEVLAKTLFGFFDAGFAYMTVYSVRMFFACARKSLRITDGFGIKNGTVEISLAELDELRWDAAFGGYVVLRSKYARIGVYLKSFKPEQAGRLIRLLRWWAPDELQQNWKAFCYYVALPQRENDERCSLREDETLLTRRGVFRTIFSLALLAAAAFCIRAWRFQQLQLVPRTLVIAVVSLAIGWLLARFWIPAKGMRAKRIARPQSRNRRVGLYLWRVLGYSAAFAFCALKEQLLSWYLAACGVFAIWTCVEWAISYPEYSRWRREYRSNVDLAAEEWDRMEWEPGAAA